MRVKSPVNSTLNSQNLKLLKILFHCKFKLLHENLFKCVKVVLLVKSVQNTKFQTIIGSNHIKNIIIFKLF